jgi:hypothetical protein
MLPRGGDYADTYNPHNYVSPYLIQPFSTVGDACRRSGRDLAGTRCAHCRVNDLCVRMGDGRRIRH